MANRLIALFAVGLALALVASTFLWAQDADRLPDPPQIEPREQADGEEEEEKDEEPKRATLNETVPDFTLSDHNGNEHKLSDHKGKIIVLEWIHWPCPYVVFHYRMRTQLNLIEKFAGKEDAPEIVWIGVNSSHDATAESSRTAAERWGVEFPVLMDPTGEVGRMYNARTTPHMYVICSDFKLRYEGAIDSDRNIRRDSHEGVTNYVEAALAALIAGKEVETQQTTPYGCAVRYPRDGRRAR